MESCENIIGNLWKALEIFGNLTKSVEIRGNMFGDLWKSVDTFGNPWKYVEIVGSISSDTYVFFISSTIRSHRESANISRGRPGPSGNTSSGGKSS